MTTATAIEIFNYSTEEITAKMNEEISQWSNGLWWEDLEEAGVERIALAWDGDDIIGYQTISLDGLCVAIEVKDTHMGQSISRQLIEESGCNRPERNENPEFWEAVSQW